MVAPKHHRGFSFGSKSSKSSSSHGSRDLPIEETPEEKARRQLHSKADPTVAMSELQPMAVAFEKSNLANIREMPHKDQYGNLITDPDLSNPTRPRFERPLDTIRSFENAVNDTFTSRNSGIFKSPTESSPGDFSRRGSYFGGVPDHGRYGPSRRQSYNDGSQAAEYSHRASRSRPRVSRRPTDQSVNGRYGGQYGSGYASGQYGGQGQGQYSPQYTNGYNGSGPGYDRYQPAQISCDNITAGSAPTEPYGISTDPSSVNSSIDHLQQQQQQQQQKRMQQEQRMSQPQPKHVFGAPAADPNSGGPVGGPVRRPVGAPAARDTGTGAVPVGDAPAPANSRRQLRKSNLSDVSTGENKRKSWFKRAFTKS